MAKKNKLWFSGEDAQLAARFTKCLTKALYNRRASYLRAKAEQAASEISIEECSEEVDKMYTPTTRPVEEIVESKLMWESIRKYLHKLTPKECEVMISLYVNDSVGVFLVQRIAALSVKHNMSSVSVLGGW